MAAAVVATSGHSLRYSARQPWRLLSLNSTSWPLAVACRRLASVTTLARHPRIATSVTKLARHPKIAPNVTTLARHPKFAALLKTLPLPAQPFVYSHRHRLRCPRATSRHSATEMPMSLNSHPRLARLTPTTPTTSAHPGLESAGD